VYRNTPVHQCIVSLTCLDPTCSAPFIKQCLMKLDVSAEIYGILFYYKAVPVWAKE